MLADSKGPGVSRSIGLIETTLRDGNQSAWAYRMTTAMMLPMLPVMDAAGFRAIEPTTAIQFDACVLYLRENPTTKRITLHASQHPHT